ncbi:GNAT family N-acetyltransferase [Cohnella rhizosphaerae]|uniref:GNAT family N-acetyltransferase n=1 Tax=Cohnella rhizosphaerae TaxID=1457232 RepID=A0A9X4KZV5_9BACL|nr:GNAT family N-acetyltransferase [Cohnella rhizosphaerae]MDG0810892.1 GNAT family N-acetyltransferase [Cohnella rhizosphaerae]
MPTIELLDLTSEDDAGDLWRLQHAAYRIEAELIGAPDLPPLHDTIATLQASEETFWGCRDDDGELVGAIAAEQAKDGTGVISRMMVHPDHFRQGIAGALIVHMMQAWNEVPGWEVTAEARNLPAIALYGRNGFVAVDTFHPREDITMVTMKLQPKT